MYLFSNQIININRCIEFQFNEMFSQIYKKYTLELINTN